MYRRKNHRVLIDNLPLLVFLETLLAEVFQKVDAELLFIEEAELLVEQLLKAATADSLRFFHHRGVELSFTGISWMSVEVDSQALTAAEPVGVRISDRGIEVEVERMRSPDISFLRRKTLVQVFIVS